MSVVKLAIVALVLGCMSSAGEIYLACSPVGIVSISLFVALVQRDSLSNTVLVAILAGCAYWYAVLYWASFVDNHTNVILQLGALTCALFESSSWLLFAITIRCVNKWPLILRITFCATAWTVADYCRTLGEWGMPYGELGVSQVHSVIGLIMPAVGSRGVTFVCILLALLFTEVYQCARHRLILAALLIVFCLTFPFPLSRNPGYTVLLNSTITVAVAHSSRDVLSIIKASPERIMRRSVLLFPEGTLRDASATLSSISQAARQRSGHVILGALGKGSAGFENDAALLGNAQVEIYTKRMLVPFGEFIPLRPFFGLFSSLPADLTRGRTALVWTNGDLHLAPLICFEVAFDRLTREASANGADVIVVPVDDAWFTGDIGNAIQVHVEEARALSLGRNIVVSSSSGFATAIMPDGRSERYDDRKLPRELWLERPRDTSYSKYGDSGTILFIAMLCLLGTVPWPPTSWRCLFFVKFYRS